ncbi:unnamed protein product [Rangifer tarandus platyrhynchus]|uniref:Uncharacterized protein n=2 Tax=Rangifer tarandus platyrhynchus TaxID=3082113 RepID=A0ACB0DZY7_RANTA|nr:unnamed protein product [Rangifer tarandus platyrhynchus]CAI9693678.1 unnamed protein product [Rangifer tarandus platyrhynchus]
MRRPGRSRGRGDAGGGGEPSPGDSPVSQKPPRSRAGRGARGKAGDGASGVLGLDWGRQLDAGLHVIEWSLKGERRQFRCTEDKCAEPGVLLTSLSGDEGRKVESLQTQGAPGPYLPPAPPGMFRSASAAPRSVSAVGAAAAPQAPERVGLLHSLGTRPSAVP